MTEEIHPTVKVIFVGSSSVGKTSLIGAIFHQEFNQQPMSTVAPTFNVVDVTQSSGNVVTLQVWDTAGQERYYSVNQLFYRDADIACVCYDPGNSASKEAVPTWIKSVIDEVPTAKIFLVLTKLDLYSEDEIATFKNEAKAMKENVAIEEIFLTSSVNKTGYENILNCAAEYMKFQPNTNAITFGKQAQGEEKEKKEKSGCC